MAGGQVHTHGGAERDASDVGLLDSDHVEEDSDLVGVALGRVRPCRLIAVTRAGKIERDATEVLGVGRELERVAGVVG
jgi:hypothetical protein